jgi:hypothetical protein
VPHTVEARLREVSTFREKPKSHNLMVQVGAGVSKMFSDFFQKQKNQKQINTTKIKT